MMEMIWLFWSTLLLESSVFPGGPFRDGGGGGGGEFPPKKLVTPPPKKTDCSARTAILPPTILNSPPPQKKKKLPGYPESLILIHNALVTYFENSDHFSI